MSLHKNPKSPFWQYSFVINGRRFHGSTKARNKKEAEIAERQIRAQAKADLEREQLTGSGPMTLDIACGRFWTEIGEKHASSLDTWANLERLLSFFGPAKRLDQITDTDVAALVAWRLGHKVTVKTKNKDGKLVERVVRGISPATVNRSALAPLKALFSRAKRVWRQSLPMEPDWRSHWQKASEERVRELDDHESAVIDAAIRDDYALWLEFARLTGLRLNETLISWSNVNLFAKQIVTTGKRGRKVVTPITPEVRAILKQCEGHHPEAVFTYVATSNRRSDVEADRRVKGERYPLTYAGAKMAWRRARAKAKVTDLRFHDLRHDTATKLLRATGNLKLVQKTLNHSDLKTTARYAHVLDEEVAEALSAVANLRKNSRNKAANVA